MQTIEETELGIVEQFPTPVTLIINDKTDLVFGVGMVPELVSKSGLDLLQSLAREMLEPSPIHHLVYLERMFWILTLESAFPYHGCCVVDQLLGLDMVTSWRSLGHFLLNKIR